MSKFKIVTPVPDFTGESAGVRFANGSAVVDHTHPSLHHFRVAGYGIEPMDGVDLDAALQSALPPEVEESQLRAEIAALEQAAGLAALRARRDALRAEARLELVDLPPGGEVHGDPAGFNIIDVVLAPDQSEPVSVWRDYAVRYLRVPAGEAGQYSKAELIRMDRDARAEA